MTRSNVLFGEPIYFPNQVQLVTSRVKLMRTKGLLKIRKLVPARLQQHLANHVMEAFPNEHYDKSTLSKIFALANSLTYIKKEALISTSHQDLTRSF